MVSRTGQIQLGFIERFSCCWNGRACKSIAKRFLKTPWRILDLTLINEQGCRLVSSFNVYAGTRFCSLALWDLFCIVVWQSQCFLSLWWILSGPAMDESPELSAFLNSLTNTVQAASNLARSSSCSRQKDKSMSSMKTRVQKRKMN